MAANSGLTHTELRALLRDLQLDLADLAALTGVQPNTVYRWLRPPDAHQALPVPVYVATILRLLRRTSLSPQHAREIALEAI